MLSFLLIKVSIGKASRLWRCVRFVGSCVCSDTGLIYSGRQDSGSLTTLMLIPCCGQVGCREATGYSLLSHGEAQSKAQDGQCWLEGSWTCKEAGANGSLVSHTPRCCWMSYKSWEQSGDSWAGSSSGWKGIEGSSGWSRRESLWLELLLLGLAKWWQL